MRDHEGTGDAAALARWVSELTLANVPAHVQRKAKDCIIDGIGCVIGGGVTTPTRTLLNVLHRHGGQGECTIPGTRAKLPLLSAAHLMGQAANSLDFDDSFRSGAPSHPGATIIPPALALGESLGVTGAEFVRAVIAGYEVSLRIGRAIQPSPARKARVYGFSTWQIFGAVAAAASLLRLSQVQILDAFGIAGVHAPVPSLRKLGTTDPRPYPWTKNSYGMACEAGVLGALLAAAGYIGSRSLLEGPEGFWIMAGSDRFAPELLTEALNERWLIEEVGFKPYGCCRWTHTLLDAVKVLGADLDAKDVARVDVYAFEELAQLQGELPLSIIDAQFHAPMLVALMLAGRSPELGLQEADMASPDIRAIAGHVHMHHDPGADDGYYRLGTLPVRVVLTTRNGERRELARESPWGSAAAGGFSRSELKEKFMRITRPCLSSDAGARLLQMLDDIEQYPMRSISALLQ